MLMHSTIYFHLWCIYWSWLDCIQATTQSAIWFSRLSVAHGWQNYNNNNMTCIAQSCADFSGTDVMLLGLNVWRRKMCHKSECHQHTKDSASLASCIWCGVYRRKSISPRTDRCGSPRNTGVVESTQQELIHTWMALLRLCICFWQGRI